MRRERGYYKREGRGVIGRGKRWVSDRWVVGAADTGWPAVPDNGGVAKKISESLFLSNF